MDDRFRIDDEPPKSQAGLWVVAAGLAGLLIIYHCFGSKEDETVTTPTAMAVAQNVESESVTKSLERQAIRWPEIAFDDLINNNPFNPRRSLERTIQGTEEDRAEIQFVEKEFGKSREAKRKQREAIAQELASDHWKVRLLLNGKQGTAALIGDRVVDVGDEVDGFKVVAIQRDGVILEPLLDEE